MHSDRCRNRDWKGHCGCSRGQQSDNRGLDINEEEGKKTQQMAREMGGQMVFIKTDLAKDKDIEHAVQQASQLGSIKYVANIAGIQHIDPVENFPMESTTLCTV